MTTGYAMGLSPQQRFLQRYNPYTDDGGNMGMSQDPDFGNDTGMISSYNQQNLYSLSGNYGGYGGYGGQGVYGGGYNQCYQGGYGIGPRMNGETQEAYNKRVEDFEDAQFERQIQLQLKNQNVPLRLQSPKDVVFDKVEILAAQINRGEQDKIAPAFDSLVKAIKDKYMVNDQLPKGMSEQKLTQIARAEARRTYAQVTGIPLSDHIEAQGSGSFWQGVKTVLSFGLADSKCAAENIAHVEGDTVNKSTKAGKILGGLTVAGLLGAALVFMAKKGKLPIIKKPNS